MKTQLQQTHLDAMRHQLIECATTRPNDIKAFYGQHLMGVGDCTFLDSDTPKYIPLLFRGKLKHYEAELVPFLLSGVDPYGQRKCGIHDCMNPQHIKQL